MELTRALKIYFLPFFAQGHLIPLVQLARLFASRGQQITIVTTPSNAQLFDKTIDEDQIRVHIIKFPSNQVGLGDGIENLVAVSDSDSAYKIYMAAHLIQPQVEAFLKQSPPDVFIPDIMFTWSKDLAKKLQLPRLVFSPISIFDMIHVIKTHPEMFDTESGPYKFLDLPHQLTLSIKPSPGFAVLIKSLLNGEEESHGVIINSFAEFDDEYTQYYENLTGRKVWHVGPSSLMVQKTLNSNITVVVKEDKHDCLTWLDTKVKDSVLYICFGSLTRMSDEQLYQMAVGLENSGHQFLWVVHRKDTTGKDEDESDKWLPEGFEERVEKEKRGMLIKGWAPQPLILNHSAIGGFLTHCGWNSVAEAISAGVPMVTMPGFGDQCRSSDGYYAGATAFDIEPFS